MQHIARLFVGNSLSLGAELKLDTQQSHYVAKVMRVRRGESLRVFNGHDGEWSAMVSELDKRAVRLEVQTALRPQMPCPDIELAFAPVKRSRMEFIVEKATEMGVRRMHIVRTQHTSQKSVRLDRLQAISTEAAEQTERLDLPQIMPETKLQQWQDDFPDNRILMFCDESGNNTRSALTALQSAGSVPISVLIGPEGGFAESERLALHKMTGAMPVSLGPRILRSDTAAVAALSLVQALKGDWSM